MKVDLSGKIAIVTGSSAGIGFATAKNLLAQGATVVLNGRSQTKLERLAQDLGTQERLKIVAADFGRPDGAAQMIKAVPRCDILVNNVGIFEPKPFEEITDAEWERMWQMNVMSGVRLSRHYLQGMREKNWGRIIFVSSESGLQIPVEMIHYGVSKTAQIAVARGIAETTVGTKITCNSVLVGPTFSEGVADFIGTLARDQGRSKAEVERDFFKTARPSSLLQRFISPEEVSNMIVYLASEEASATNGSALRVDGGVVRAI